jgi:hypothetical protein
MPIDLSAYGLLPIYLVSLIVILAACEIGHQLGVRTAKRTADNVSTLEAALIGLLALMIGFTFSMALTRSESRLQAVLSEANAIGTTALRARLLPQPHNQESLKLLRNYARLQLDIVRRMPPAGEPDAAVTSTGAIVEALWQEAKAVAARDNAMVPTGLFIQSLNEMIDAQETRLTMSRHQVPNVVLLGLYAVAAVVSAFTGYASASESRRWRISVYVMVVLVCAVILLIQDLDRPGAGFIQVNLQPMIDTAMTIASYMD